MLMFSRQTGILLLLALALPITCGAQPPTRIRSASEAAEPGTALLSVGLQIEKTALDCSHFVNSIFQRAGFSYRYEPSRTLYRGIPGFRRVSDPAAGDLVVWPGHVGIVVDPAAQTFLSKLTHGIKVTSYTSRYWKGRGHPRFFRYAVPVSDSTWIARNTRPTSPANSGSIDQSFSEMEGVR